MAASVAALISTDFSGLTGINFNLWLKYFFREINPIDIYDNIDLFNINFPSKDDFWE
jgi:hypothetical protein